VGLEIKTATDKTVVKTLGITQWVFFRDEKAFQHLIAYSTQRYRPVQERERGLEQGLRQGQGLVLVLPPVQITPQRRPETMEPPTPTLTPRHQQVGTNFNLSIWSTYTITSS
jgi:hypothetical protein